MPFTHVRKSLRVLILEDIPTDAELMEQELRSAGIEFVSARADDRDSFLHAIHHFHPEIILSDFSLPSFDGGAALLIARETAPEVPFVFVTGAMGEERAVGFLKSGATDFVLKDRLFRLPLCVQRALEEAEEKRRRLKMEEDLHRAHVELERKVEERTRELSESEARFRLFSGTAGRLLASEDPQGIVNELCRQVMEHLDCHVFFNFLVDEPTGRLRLNAFAGIPQDEAVKITWLDYGAAVCGCAARDDVGTVADGIFHTPDPRTDLVRPYGIQAYACHPLKVRKKVIGTLSFGAKTRTSFSPGELDLMKTVTDQVATAMERMILIQELQTSRDELEIRVKTRTAELWKANESLRLRTTMLEQSNRDLEDFTHVFSHDLQEPARKIQTFADLLETKCTGDIDGKASDYLKRLRQSAGRMQELVLDLLHYSSATSRTDPFTLFNLKEPVEEAVTDLWSICEETDGRIELGVLPDVLAVKVQMRQLFHNLICNGLKYRGEDKPVVKVYDRSSVSDPFREIHVQDNGIGFDECYLDKIFKPFQRLHGKDSPYPGTGMGLAICRRIVESHGGDITARSATGKGSTFIVRLPKEQQRGKL
ncbi:MAG: ATP-binding protein [Desulfobacterales bacterium]|nr:ATP-binding protein [Desulfobacterales bacterium]